MEKGGTQEAFKNVIYSYPLSNAMTDGFVKEPAVATRENFNVQNYDDAALERLKLEDGVRIHENTKVELEVYARENSKPIVKPFVLVIARDTEHANALMKMIEEDTFFEHVHVDNDFSGIFRFLHIDKLLDGFVPLLPALLGMDLNDLALVTTIKECFLFDHLHKRIGVFRIPRNDQQEGLHNGPAILSGVNLQFNFGVLMDAHPVFQF